jgi:hypothetical protein
VRRCGDQGALPISPEYSDLKSDKCAATVVRFETGKPQTGSVGQLPFQKEDGSIKPRFKRDFGNCSTASVSNRGSAAHLVMRPRFYMPGTQGM